MCNVFMLCPTSLFVLSPWKVHGSQRCVFSAFFIVLTCVGLSVMWLPIRNRRRVAEVAA
jgi:hypothetical protein